MLDRGAPLPVVQKALRHSSIGSTGVYLEADGRDVDKWREQSVAGGSVPAAQVASVAEVRAEMGRLRAEMKRLAALAVSMQGEQGTPEPATGTASGEM